MKTPKTITVAKVAILTLVEIKAAVEAFDRGETNVLRAIDVIQAAVEAYSVATCRKRRCAGIRPRAA